MIKTIGIRAHDYGKMTSLNLAQAVKRDGMASVQLALNKAITGIEHIDQLLTEDELMQIGADFKKTGVDISVLGCYLNYAHPDKTERKRNLEIYKKHIGYMQHLGGRVVGTETGSMQADYSYCKENHHKDAYNIFAASLYELLDVAEAQKVNIAIEGVWDHIIYSNERMKMLIDDMKSDRLKVILDPVNLLNSENYINHNDIIQESFALFGDRIEVIHAKDYRVQEGQILEVSHGSGQYHYEFLLELVKSSSIPIDILLENADVNNISTILSLFK